MTDVGTELLQAASTFGAKGLKKASELWKDSDALLAALAADVPEVNKARYAQLRSEVETGKAPQIKAEIEKQAAAIAKLAEESVAETKPGVLAPAAVQRIAGRLATALLAIDKAVDAVATALATDPGGVVKEPEHLLLLNALRPWKKPFKKLDPGNGNIFNSFAKTLLGNENAVEDLGEVIEADVVDGEFRLAAQITAKESPVVALKLEALKLETFLVFGPDPAAEPPVFGVRLTATIKPDLSQEPLLKKVMPEKDLRTLKPTTVSLDSAHGLYIGDGTGTAAERASLPLEFAFPGVEVREMTLGLTRDPTTREARGLELATIVAAKLGGVVDMKVVGAGAKIALDASSSPVTFSVRPPDAVGLRIAAGPVKGGGYIERKTRKYDDGGTERDIVEYGGAIQLEVLKVGVYAIVVLSPDPFSFVVVMGVRFPVAIELSFGFTLNAVGGLLALDRTVDSGELRKGLRDHFVDRVLFPEDPVAEAPGLIDQVAKVFPRRQDGFVVGPIVELGWGSQARIVEAKLGIILALPDPKLIVLGAVRIRAPAKDAPLTDIRAEVDAEVNTDGLTLFAALSDSKIAGINVSGELGLLIQWGGGGDFALSVGGFNPRYNAIPPPFAGLRRLTMDLAAPPPVEIKVQAYFAVTAGAVMAGVRGDLSADLRFASGHAWLELDIIFIWAPRFGFAVDLDIGITIEALGRSFASVSFRGSLEGTTPWRVEGKATVKVWFAPPVRFHLGPFHWGEVAKDAGAKIDPLKEAESALNAPEAWKAVLPLDADLMVGLHSVEGEGLVAHPLAALEITQSRLPLETHIDRIGSRPVSANAVTMGPPTTSTGEVGAVSTVTAPFAPGQFLELRDEDLLAKAGFEQMTSGCRVAAANAPISGEGLVDEVKWHTYYREDGKDREDKKLRSFNPALFTAAIASFSPAAEAIAQRDNPFIARPDKVNPAAGVTIRDPGATMVRLVDDGALVAGLDEMSASEAGRVAEAINASGPASVVAVAVGAL